MSNFYGDLTVAGATDCMTRFELRDSANDPITDAVAADLTITYQIDPDDTPVSISLSDLGSIGAAHTDGGVIHIAAGVYRLDLPDAVLAAGVAGKRPLISIVHADATINYLEPVVAFTPTSNQAAIGSLNDLSQLAVESAAQVGATAALNNYDPPTKAEIDAAIATLATAAALGVVDNVVDAIKAKTDNLPASPAATGDIPTAAQNRAEMDSNSTQLAAIVEDTGTTLPAAIAAIDAGGGSGAYTVTVTVTDGTDPLEGATVRLTEGASTFALPTDANGQAQFALDAATYAVAVTKAGYQFAPTTRTVTGEELGTLTDDLELTATTLPAPSPDADTCNVYLNAEDIENELAAGIVVEFALVGGPAKTERMLTVANSASMTTAADGSASITLQRNDEITPSGTYYEVTCAALGLDRKRMILKAASYNLASLIS